MPCHLKTFRNFTIFKTCLKQSRISQSVFIQQIQISRLKRCSTGKVTQKQFTIKIQEHLENNSI